MAQYPALIERSKDGFTVSFRDIPEALTCGDTWDEAISMAEDALLTSLDFYFEDRRPVPLPSAAKAGETLIKLPHSAYAKILLLNEMIASKVTPTELARRLQTTKQAVNRILDFQHSTKIDTLQMAYDAVVGTPSMEIAVRRWLRDRAEHAEAADPELRNRKERVRQTTDYVNSLTDDDPKFLQALKDQSAAIDELVKYSSTRQRLKA
ncbi:hypothetical protein MyNCGM121_39400 [Achromobacter xylosoxidans]